MQSHATGWKRLGISLSLIWALAVCGLATYEWLAFAPTSYFVESVVVKTGEPASVSTGNAFADLVPLAPKLNQQLFLSTLLLPVLGLWLVGGLWFWVSAGFKRNQP